MSKYMTAALYTFAAIVASQPVLAADPFSTPDSHGPRQPLSERQYIYDSNTETCGDTPPVRYYDRNPVAVAQASFANSPWSYQGESPKAYVDPRPSDLTEQLAENEAYRQESIERLNEDGGCNADVVPYGYAVQCDAFLVNNAPFGGSQNRQMGSDGN